MKNIGNISTLFSGFKAAVIYELENTVMAAVFFKYRLDIFLHEDDCPIIRINANDQEGGFK